MLNNERGRGKMATLRLEAGQIEVVDDTIAEILPHRTMVERIRIGFTILEGGIIVKIGGIIKIFLLAVRGVIEWPIT